MSDASSDMEHGDDTVIVSGAIMRHTTDSTSGAPSNSVAPIANDDDDDDDDNDNMGGGDGGGGGGGAADDEDADDDVLREHVTALTATHRATAGFTHATEAAMRLIERQTPARDQADAQLTWALFSRPPEHWTATARGQARTGLFEIATVALGVFAHARVLTSADPVIELDLPRPEAEHSGGGGDNDEADAVAATDLHTARAIVAALHDSMRNVALIPVLANPDTALSQQLHTLGEITAWEYRLRDSTHADAGGNDTATASCLDDGDHVRLRAEVVNWLMVWQQIAKTCGAWGLRQPSGAIVPPTQPRQSQPQRSPGAAAEQPTEDAWFRERIDVVRTHTRPDLYMRRSAELCAELLAPPGLHAVYKRVFPASATVTIQTMMTLLVPTPAFALVCTRCAREYDGRRWADPRALAMAEAAAANPGAAALSRPSATAAAAKDATHAATARAPMTSAIDWTVRLAVPPHPTTLGMEIRRAAVQAATAAAAIHATATGAPIEDAAVAAAAADADGDELAQERFAPLPAWARAATEDAWQLQAWFTALDQRMAAMGTVTTARGGVGVAATHRNVCRARYFVHTGDAGAADRLAGVPVVGGRRPLPTVWYAMPGAVAVHCHVCGRTTQHSTARAAVNAWLREVRGPCHRNADEFGQPLLL